ncbi:MAG: dihydroorotate dehydrogenase electron transfer subunit [Clostridia bacterium]|nr:dihydroorotate dehydrogenase electron transfer subunit [Clostridia bacterium]
MKAVKYKVLRNDPVADGVYDLVLSGDTSAFTAPGQFLNITVDGLYLRRPFSVCSYGGDAVRVLYKVVGEGTKRMTALRPGDAVDALTGLGNGFDAGRAGESPVLIGGGIGTPPVYSLARELVKRGVRPAVYLGFNSSSDVVLAAEFAEMGVVPVVATADGSLGEKGFVTDVIDPSAGSYYYACGPVPMLKAVVSLMRIPGEVSLEERMGCGFGVCEGCAVRTSRGVLRVCADGPVFRAEEVIW